MTAEGKEGKGEAESEGWRRVWWRRWGKGER
jgi:hypothetical protein